MEDVPDIELEELLLRSRRYVAFVDVLGYRSILADNATSSASKLRRLHSVFETLALSVRDARDNWNYEKVSRTQTERASCELASAA